MPRASPNLGPTHSATAAGSPARGGNERGRPFPAGSGIWTAVRSCCGSARRSAAACATAFGTLPRIRFAPFMPLFPTTIRSTCCSSASATIRSATGARRGVGLGLDALCAGVSGDALEHRVGDAECVERPGVGAGHLRDPERSLRAGLVHGHDMQRRAERLRELRRDPDGLARPSRIRQSRRAPTCTFSAPVVDHATMVVRLAGRPRKCSVEQVQRST